MATHREDRRVQRYGSGGNVQSARHAHCERMERFRVAACTRFHNRSANSRPQEESSAISGRCHGRTSDGCTGLKLVARHSCAGRRGAISALGGESQARDFRGEALGDEALAGPAHARV